MIDNIIRGFKMVYKKSACGPDGISPIISDYIEDKEEIRRLAI